MIEKPLATDVKDSRRVYDAIQKSGVDAVIGYTNRFRRRFLTIKERLRNGDIGEVTTVTTRAFMNRMVPIATLRTDQREGNLQPMVVSGTHSLDMSLWLMEGKEPVEIYARSVDKVLGTDRNEGCDLRHLHHERRHDLEHEHQLGPADRLAGGGLRPGDRDRGHQGGDHRSTTPIATWFSPRKNRSGPVTGRRVTSRSLNATSSSSPASRPGTSPMGQMWGPMREETNSWFTRLYMGIETPHATAWDGHRNLVLTMAMGLSAERGIPLKLPDRRGGVLHVDAAVSSRRHRPHP